MKIAVATEARTGNTIATIPLISAMTPATISHLRARRTSALVRRGHPPFEMRLDPVDQLVVGRRADRRGHVPPAQARARPSGTARTIAARRGSSPAPGSWCRSWDRRRSCRRRTSASVPRRMRWAAIGPGVGVGTCEALSERTQRRHHLPGHGTRSDDQGHTEEFQYDEEYADDDDLDRLEHIGCGEVGHVPSDLGRGDAETIGSRSC